MWKRAAISDTGISARFEQSADGFDLFGGELRWSAPGSTTGASCFETRDGSFADQVALELGEGGEDMENEPPGRRAGFNLLGQGFEVDLTLFELCDKADEVGQIAAQAQARPRRAPNDPPDDRPPSLVPHSLDRTPPSTPIADRLLQQRRVVLQHIVDRIHAGPTA